jgi:hypothetical protein
MYVEPSLTFCPYKRALMLTEHVLDVSKVLPIDDYEGIGSFFGGFLKKPTTTKPTQAVANGTTNGLTH